VLQIGAPDHAEVGFLLGTMSNITQVANGVFSLVGDDCTSFSNDKTDLCSNSIFALAGKKHPMAYWTKGEELAKDLVEWSKTAADTVAAYKELSALPAKEKKQAAEKKLAEAKENEQQDPSAENKQKVAEAQAEVQKQDEALAKTEERFDVLLAEVTAGVISDVAAAAEKGLELVDKTIKPLYSMLSKSGADATRKTLHHSAEEAQQRMADAAKDAKERTAADIGKFAAKPKEDEEEKQEEGQDELRETEAKEEGEAFNLQASTHTASLLGDDNAFVFGLNHATLGSDKQAALISGDWAHVRGITGVEIAGGDEVKVTATSALDLQSDSVIKLVAHEAETELAAPDGFDLLLHCKTGIMLESTEKDIRLAAQDNGLFGWGNTTAAFAAGGGSGFGLLATGSALNVGALSAVDKDSVAAVDDCTISFESSKIEAVCSGAKMTLESGKFKATDGSGELTIAGARSSSARRRR